MLLINPATTKRTLERGNTILLVASPGHLRDALLSLLSTLPDLAVIFTAISSAQAFSKACQSRPDLLLIAGGLLETELVELLRQCKQTWPNLPCLVIAENTRQVARAQQAGATLILPARTPSQAFLAELQRCLSSK
jgi:DNA-binding NarL/FixJ family response regulator